MRSLRPTPRAIRSARQRRPFLPRLFSVADWARTRAIAAQPPFSDKCESEQARAQKQEAGHSHCEESVGNEVIITHGAPSAPNTGANSLKVSESGFAKGGCVVLAEIRPATIESPQMSERGKCRR